MTELEILTAAFEGVTRRKAVAVSQANKANDDLLDISRKMSEFHENAKKQPKEPEKALRGE